jgi:hypothetical protein
VADEVTGEQKQNLCLSEIDARMKNRNWDYGQERTKDGKMSLYKNRIIKMAPQPGKLRSCTETTNCVPVRRLQTAFLYGDYKLRSC